MKKYQQLQSISELKEGEIIRSKREQIYYLVHDTYGDRATAVRIADITNPDEWDVYRDVDDEPVK